MCLVLKDHDKRNRLDGEYCCIMCGNVVKDAVNYLC